MKAFQTVLFLCTGNFYRSRHAEAWFNFHSSNRDLPWKARSRGFRPHLATEDLSHYVTERLQIHGISPSMTGALPSKVSEEDLAEASLVIALYEAEHLPMMKESFPAWSGRIQYWNVADIDEIHPDLALPHIEAKVESLIESLSSGHARGTIRDDVVEF